MEQNLQTSWTQQYSSTWIPNVDNTISNQIEKRIDHGDLDLANNILRKIQNDTRGN
jgi:hypothetical protein